MTTAEQFLNAFNTIERYLTQYNLNKGYASFSRLVDYAVLKDKVVAQYKDDLKQCYLKLILLSSLSFRYIMARLM